MKNDEILEVKIKKREIGWVVWFVPLIALIVGGWMIYKYYAKLGPTIVITFDNSGGIEPKSSFIKFRDVKVGVVEKVEILKAKDGVLVVARMNKDVEPFLNETTKFWIVKPEIGAGEVRGLDALVSGAYIQMHAKLGKKSKREFKGLDEPPLLIDEGAGKNFKLIAPTAYDLYPGAKIYYKDIQVGKVQKIDLSQNGENVYIYAFIKEPFAKYVNDSTRFWKVEAARVSLNSAGVDVELSSLSKIVGGGIAFETTNLDTSSTRNHFWLYPSQNEALQKNVGIAEPQWKEFAIHFDKGAGYLQNGSKIYYKGIIVGKIKDLRKSINSDGKVCADVIALIDLSTFKTKVEQDGFKRFRDFVAHGLKATIQENMPFVKSSHIELVVTGEKKELKKDGKYYVVPSFVSLSDDLVKKVDRLLQKLQNLPLEEMIKSYTDLAKESGKPLKGALEKMKRTFEELNTLLKSKEVKDLPKQLQKDLTELEMTLRNFSNLAKGYSEGSMFKDRVDSLLKDIDKAAKDMSDLVKKLEKKPNALIFGE